MMAGCPGGEVEPVTPEPPQAQPVTSPKPAPHPQTEKKKTAPEPEKSKPDQEKPAVKKQIKTPPAKKPTPEPSVSKSASRPEKVADWKKEDFLSAKKDQDPFLIDALKHLGQKETKNPEVGTIAAELLKNTEASQPENQVGRRSLGMPEETIRAIMSVLAVNETPQAEKTLRDIVTGQLKTDFDQLTTRMALEILTTKPSPENNQVLLIALVDPIKYRPAVVENKMGTNQRKTILANELERLAKQTISQTPSASLRKKLAQYLLSPEAKSMHLKEFGPLLERIRPENIPAQIRLYNEQVLHDNKMAQLDRGFMNYSSYGLAVALKLLENGSKEESSVVENQEATSEKKASASSRWKSSKPSRNGSKSTLINDSSLGQLRTTMQTFGLKLETSRLEDELDPIKMVREIWEPDTMKAVGNRLQTIDSFSNKPASLLDFAKTVPYDRVRSVLYQLMKRCYQEGLQQAFSYGMSGCTLVQEVLMEKSDNGEIEVPKSIFDPGLLVTAKQVVVTKTEESAHGPSKKDSSGASRSNAQVTLRWMDQIQSLAKDLFSLARVAASPAGPLAEEEEEPCPFNPHSDKGIVARYHVKFPEDARAVLGKGDFDPLEIHYIRLEETAQPEKVLKHYSRATKSPGFPLPEGFWFPMLEDGSRPGTKRSVDVRILKAKVMEEQPDEETKKEPKGRGARRKNPGIPLVIEILSVEINDPSGEKTE